MCMKIEKGDCMNHFFKAMALPLFVASLGADISVVQGMKALQIEWIKPGEDLEEYLDRLSRNLKEIENSIFSQNPVRDDDLQYLEAQLNKMSEIVSYIRANVKDFPRKPEQIGKGNSKLKATFEAILETEERIHQRVLNLHAQHFFPNIEELKRKSEQIKEMSGVFSRKKSDTTYSSEGVVTRACSLLNNWNNVKDGAFPDLAFVYVELCAAYYSAEDEDKEPIGIIRDSVLEKINNESGSVEKNVLSDLSNEVAKLISEYESEMKEEMVNDLRSLLEILQNSIPPLTNVD